MRFLLESHFFCYIQSCIIRLSTLDNYIKQQNPPIDGF